ncbi:hypothetical protein DFJ74DRAFT_646919 [Hyaloraphidium curvatum]|nr:hypothetical protein DFJ74DRAFT_646919 [Hyaloraphidium curvatum]
MFPPAAVLFLAALGSAGMAAGRWAHRMVRPALAHPRSPLPVHCTAPAAGPDLGGTPWTCVRDRSSEAWTPVKLTARGHAACLSLDSGGRDCVWTNAACCGALAASADGRTPFFECGARYVAAYNHSGYGAGWCTEADDALGPGFGPNHNRNRDCVDRCRTLPEDMVSKCLEECSGYGLGFSLPVPGPPTDDLAECIKTCDMFPESERPLQNREDSFVRCVKAGGDPDACRTAAEQQYQSCGNACPPAPLSHAPEISGIEAETGDLPVNETVAILEDITEGYAVLSHDFWRWYPNPITALEGCPNLVPDFLDWHADMQRRRPEAETMLAEAKKGQSFSAQQVKAVMATLRRLPPPVPEQPGRRAILGSCPVLADQLTAAPMQRRRRERAGDGLRSVVALRNDMEVDLRCNVTVFDVSVSVAAVVYLPTLGDHVVAAANYSLPLARVLDPVTVDAATGQPTFSGSGPPDAAINIIQIYCGYWRWSDVSTLATGRTGSDGKFRVLGAAPKPSFGLWGGRDRYPGRPVLRVVQPHHL